MNSAALTDMLAEYMPSVLYLAVICLAFWISGKIASWVHPTLLLAGLAARVTVSGWQDPSITTALALLVFVVLVLLAGATVSGATIFTLCVTLALTPLAGWLGLLMGLLVAAAVATRRTWKHLGKSRVAWLAMDTMSAVGVSTAGGLQRPDLSLIPERSALTDVSAHSEEAARLKMYLAPYLLLGVGAAAALAYVAS